MLRPVQALCSREFLVTIERGVVKYKATHLGASTASRLRTRLAINLVLRHIQEVTRDDGYQVRRLQGLLTMAAT